MQDELRGFRKGGKPVVEMTDSRLGVTSYPAGIIAFREALWTRQASPGRFFRPEGRTWSADPRGMAVNRAHAGARRERDV